MLNLETAIANRTIVVDAVKKTLERVQSAALTASQVTQIKMISEAMQEPAVTPVIFGRDQSVLICLGASAAYILKLQVAACSDLTGTSYLLQGLGVGARWGVFVFAALHDSDQPLAPQFKMAAAGATANQALQELSILQNFAQVAPLVGPELGLFHSIYGNQAGILLGINMGKVIGFGGINFLVHDTFSELLSDVRSGVTSIDYEEFKQRLENRKKRLGYR